MNDDSVDPVMTEQELARAREGLNDFFAAVANQEHVSFFDAPAVREPATKVERDILSFFTDDSGASA
jgi:hypothetical protein